MAHNGSENESSSLQRMFGRKILLFVLFVACAIALIFWIRNREEPLRPDPRLDDSTPKIERNIPMH
jgi:hypothetical protein